MKKTLLLFVFLIPSFPLVTCERVSHTSPSQTCASSDFLGVVKVDSVVKNTVHLQSSTIYKGRATNKIKFTTPAKNSILGGAML